MEEFIGGLGAIVGAIVGVVNGYQFAGIGGAIVMGALGAIVGPVVLMFLILVVILYGIAMLWDVFI